VGAPWNWRLHATEHQKSRICAGLRPGEPPGMAGTAKLIRPDFVPEPFRYRGAKRAQETCKYTLKMEEK